MFSPILGPSKKRAHGKLLRLIRKYDGNGTEALAAEANAERVQVLTLLKELEADGKVRRTGQRRGTRWFVDTSE